MIPQHSGAPFRQQRFIEIENTGLVTVPAHGVVEITDSYRPEKTGGKTPNGGRTVLKVERATADSPKASIVNGPCDIAAAGKGRVGTMDSPMIALVDSDYDVGTEIGVAKDTFVLTDGQTGYIMLGDYDAVAGTARVARHFTNEGQVRRGCLAENHPGCGVVFDLKLGTWNPATDEWDYEATASAKGIDFWYSIAGPYPDAGATGWFRAYPSTTHGTLWNAWDIGCDPDNCGECGGGY